MIAALQNSLIEVTPTQIALLPLTARFQENAETLLISSILGPKQTDTYCQYVQRQRGRRIEISSETKKKTTFKFLEIERMIDKRGVEKSIARRGFSAGNRADAMQIILLKDTNDPWQMRSGLGDERLALSSMLYSN